MEPPTDSRPVHLVPPGARYTLCGLRRTAPGAFPQVAPRHAGPPAGVVCARCAVAARTLDEVGREFLAERMPIAWLREVEPDRWEISDRD